MEFASAFGLSQEEAKRFCDELGRLPSKEELAVCGALWSEHCSYKSSRVHLKRFHTQEPWVLQGPGENAGVIAITKNYGIVFKMESHNHPSYIEPYQGAATGVGGILRDIFCMGAQPIANLNCLRFGEGTWNATLLKETVRGIGDYGNSVGVPTVGGDLSFHFNYTKNILVNAFTAGLIHKDKIFKGILSEGEENTDSKNQNILIYFGSATGRDGVHGATMSSAEFANSSVTLKPTVQVGDPFAEKILLSATLSLIEKKLVLGLQDMGAAGLTSSTVEMAARSGCGVTLDLNKVPLRASNMEPWEILLSESQERMVCAVTPDKVDAVLEELRKFNLSYSIIGQVNNSGLFVCTFDQKIVTEIPVTLLVEDVPRYTWPLQEKSEYLKEHIEIQNEAILSPDEKSLSIPLSAKNLPAHNDIESDINLESLVEKYPDLIQNIFSHPANASRAAIYHHYCSTVQGNTITGCGTFKSSAAAVIRLPREAQEEKNGHHTQIGVALAAGCEERFVELDPYTGSALSVLKIARKIIATGGTPLAMTDCLNFGSPKSPAVMRQFSDTVDGINLVAKELHIPIVSGNVSLNNQTSGRPIPPTPMLGIVGKVDDVSHIPLDMLPLRYFNETTNKEIYLVHLQCKNAQELSSYQASQTAWILGEKNSRCPKIDLNTEKILWETLQKIILQEKPLMCFPVGHGGVLGALISCALKSQCELELTQKTWKTSAQNLFAEGNMGFIAGFQTEILANIFIQAINNSNLIAEKIGCFKPAGTPIQKTVFDFEKTLKSFLNSLHRYFNINIQLGSQ